MRENILMENMLMNIDTEMKKKELMLSLRAKLREK
jgi:hypothetical protein